MLVTIVWFIVYLLVILFITELVFTFIVKLEHKDRMKQKKFTLNPPEVVEKKEGKEGQVCFIDENVSKMTIFEFIYFIDIKNNYLLEDLGDALLVISKELFDIFMILLLIVTFPITILVRAIVGIGDSKVAMREKAKEMVR